MTGWGRTPIVYLASLHSDKGYTSVPEYQDPWQRGLYLNGLDYPDGWRDMEAWAWYSAHVLSFWRHVPTKAVEAPRKPRKVRVQVTATPDVMSLQRVGLAPPPRGLTTRFYVSRPVRGKHLIYDMNTGQVAAGTRREGYATVEEAKEVAEDLRDNRPNGKYARPPF